jgi:hypothetical protein
MYISFFLHANLQYAEFPRAATPLIVEQSYRPACQLFLRHPWARAVFEFSGYSLEILAADYPDVIDDLRALVRGGQVELCASTYANPILPLIPLDHARRQIAAFRRVYDDLFGDLGIAPAGFFPQEFALDASLIPLIRDAGYTWAPIMLNHYLASLAGHLNIIPDLPLRASANVPRAVDADTLHPFRIAGARGGDLVGIVNDPIWIDRLFELSNGVIAIDDVVAELATLHERHSPAGPAFVFLGPSDMEFVGLEFRRLIPDWRWPAPIRPDDLAGLLVRLRDLSFVRFATAREYLAEHPPANPPLYLKCGSDHPLLTPWTVDPDNERLNTLCREAADRIRLAEALLRLDARQGAGGHAAVRLLDDAWRAMLLAENSDGRGWLPIPERRLFCYDQALRAIDLADQALAALRS